MMTKSTRRRSNPFRRKRNPIGSITGLVSAAVMAAVGVSIFDVVAMKVAPAQQGLMRTGIKAAGAWAVMSYGNKIPILGKYKSEIALVLATAAAIDVLKIYVFPMVAQVANGVVPNLIPTGDDTTAGIYGNAPVYSPYGRFS